MTFDDAARARLVALREKLLRKVAFWRGCAEHWRQLAAKPETQDLISKPEDMLEAAKLDGGTADNYQADADALTAALAHIEAFERKCAILENYYPTAADSTDDIYQREIAELPPSRSGR